MYTGTGTFGNGSSFPEKKSYIKTIITDKSRIWYNY